MRTHKTKNGIGFINTEEQAKKESYNALQELYEGEGLMRTFYLVRDIFTTEELVQLEDHVRTIIDERREHGGDYEGENKVEESLRSAK